jgi:hypothetical protein
LATIFGIEILFLATRLKMVSPGPALSQLSLLCKKKVNKYYFENTTSAASNYDFRNKTWPEIVFPISVSIFVGTFYTFYMKQNAF